jgi:hypothetical protein
MALRMEPLARGVAQVVECLPSKCEALSSSGRQTGLPGAGITVSK